MDNQTLTEEINALEAGKELLRKNSRYKWAKVRKVNTNLGRPIYLVNYFAHGMLERSYGYDSARNALEALSNQWYTPMK